MPSIAPSQTGPAPIASQERGEHGCSGFMAPVAEEAGEPDAEDGAVKPSLFLLRRQPWGNSLQLKAKT